MIPCRLLAISRWMREVTRWQPRCIAGSVISCGRAERAEAESESEGDNAPLGFCKAMFI